METEAKSLNEKLGTLLMHGVVETIEIQNIDDEGDEDPIGVAMNGERLPLGFSDIPKLYAAFRAGQDAKAAP